MKVSEFIFLAPKINMFSISIVFDFFLSCMCDISLYLCVNFELFLLKACVECCLCEMVLGRDWSFDLFLTKDTHTHIQYGDMYLLITGGSTTFHFTNYATLISEVRFFLCRKKLGYSTCLSWISLFCFFFNIFHASLFLIKFNERKDWLFETFCVRYLPHQFRAMSKKIVLW